MWCLIVATGLRCRTQGLPPSSLPYSLPCFLPSFIPFFLLSFLLMPCYMFSNSSCCHYSSSLCFCYVFPFSYHSLTVTSVTVFLSRGREASALLRLPMYAAAAIKSLQSCLTLCDPIDGSPPGSPIPGILQARTLEWVAISFSDAWKWKVKVKSLSCVQLLATPWLQPTRLLCP